MFEIITIPFDPLKQGFDTEPLNRFAANKIIRSSRAEFFRQGDTSFWTVFLEYEPVIKPTTKAESLGLDEPGRIFFDRLKQWRKTRAEKDGVPVFIVATNSELKDIVLQRPKSLEVLKTIKGFGKGKIAKYGTEIVEQVKAFYAPTDGKRGTCQKQDGPGPGVP